MKHPPSGTCPRHSANDRVQPAHADPAQMMNAYPKLARAWAALASQPHPAILQSAARKAARKGALLLFWLAGLASLAWLLLRSGLNPRRLAYPCQQAALANSLAFLAYLGSLLGFDQLRRLLHPRRPTLSGFASLALLAALATALTGSQPILRPSAASLNATADPLPGWTSPSAISNVYAVENVPLPTCSLDGGSLPPTGPCQEPAIALADAGIDNLLNEMQAQGEPFYQTDTQPDGLIAAGDVVVIKVNNQWGGQGGDMGWGRLSTNTDVVKGLLWRIVQHPDGFTGEIVLAENTQDVNVTWDDFPANSEDQNQSYQDVVDVFVGLGYDVSVFSWDNLNETLIHGGDASDQYPQGEYITGNYEDAYILLNDPEWGSGYQLSYPKFQTNFGTWISMRHVVLDGSIYHPDDLTWFNLPVLKKHGMAGATIAWKNLIGFLTIANYNSRFGGWDEMHGFFWGYQELGDVNFGALGKQMALVRAPDLNIVDAIWVAYEANYYGDAVRRDVLLASRDPFAVDWYASEYVLRPVIPYDADYSSAARGGTFRSATRINQNAAAAAWTGSTYPYIDLIDTYDGNTPSNDEKNQMNVYVVGVSECMPISSLSIQGPELGEPGVPYTFTAAPYPPTASQPITYLWDNAVSSMVSQRTFETPGAYLLEVSATNPCSSAFNATHTIHIQDLLHVFLPLARK